MNLEQTCFKANKAYSLLFNNLLKAKHLTRVNQLLQNIKLHIPNDCIDWFACSFDNHSRRKLKTSNSRLPKVNQRAETGPYNNLTLTTQFLLYGFFIIGAECSRAANEECRSVVCWSGVPLRTKIRRIIFHSKSNVIAVEVEYFEFEVEYIKIEVENMKFEVENMNRSRKHESRSREEMRKLKSKGNGSSKQI